MSEQASGVVIPCRPAPQQGEALRRFLAARAQGRAAPKIDDERARHLAVVLQVAADDFVGGKPPEIHGGWRRQGARIGGGQVSPRRAYIPPPPEPGTRGGRPAPAAPPRPP